MYHIKIIHYICSRVSNKATLKFNEMKEALSYIEAEVHLQNILIEKYYEELNKTDFLISRAHWQHEIKNAKAQILQLENVKHLLEK